MVYIYLSYVINIYLNIFSKLLLYELNVIIFVDQFNIRNNYNCQNKIQI